MTDIDTPLPVVLLAEDELAHLRLFERSLARSKLEIDFVAVKNGQEALNFLDAEADLGVSRSLVLILDLKMPVLNGIQVLERMRANDALAHFPVIVLTTSDEPEEVKQCRKLGVQHYLIKPIDIEEVEKHILAILETG